MDDVVSVKNIYVPELGCDLIYSMYGKMYGFNSKEIKEQLEEGSTIIITNDQNTINKIKKIFGQKVVMIYVLSDVNKRTLGNIYMERLGFPPLKKEIKYELLMKLEEGKDKLFKDESKGFYEWLENINKKIDGIVFKDKRFLLRLDSIKHQEEIDLSLYNYAVFNSHLNNTPTIQPIQTAYEKIKEIITKEQNKEGA